MTEPMNYQFHKENTIPPRGWVWVFGSNLKGQHGSGAAKVAHANFSAPYGAFRGSVGQAYAIPTNDKKLNLICLVDIKNDVAEFLEVAKNTPKSKYFVTRIGCGFSGYEDSEIAPFFRGAPDNCSFNEAWKGYL